MNTSESMKDTLELQPIGTDFWPRPVYKDVLPQLAPRRLLYLHVNIL